MSTPVLEPRAIYALRPEVRQNAHYITDHEVLYPGGAVLIFHDFLKKKQRYIKLLKKSLTLEAIIISPTRSMCAFIDNGDTAQILIYHTETLKKLRKLTLPPEATTNRIESICFSHDEKLLLAITGEPDWMMLSFNWEKGKVETQTRANYLNSTTPVSMAIYSPMDSAVACVWGPGLFRLMNMQETVWRQYGFQKADTLEVTTAAFVGGDRVIAGTKDGQLFLVDAGELKGFFNAFGVTLISTKEKEEGATTTVPKPLVIDSGGEDVQVRCLIAFTKGFAYSCKSGQVHLFEKETNHRYRKRNLFVIDEPDLRETRSNDLNVVKHLTVNKTDTAMLVTTNRSQLYWVQLWGPDLLTTGSVYFNHLGESLHHGPITGLSLCAWKPIFMTCGAVDRTVRIWNYETEQLELVKQYMEDVHSVALHPTGLFANIGFSDKLRFMTILINDLQTCSEFPIRECKLSVFSSHGQFFAAAAVTNIIIYSCVTFHQLWSLRGHNQRIRAMKWTQDDKRLVSCGAEGAVYEWNMATAKRSSEVVTKSVAYSDCAVTCDANLIFAVGNDGLLKEFKESAIFRVLEIGQKNVEHIVLSRSDAMLFICGDNFSVLSLRMPLIEPIDYTSYQYHCSTITQMKLSYDDRTLITVSNIGTLCIWNLSYIEGKTIPMDENFTYFEEIMINKLDLEEKVQTIYDQRQRIHEVEMEHTYQVRQTDAANADRKQEVLATYIQAIEELKAKNEQIEMEHNTELNNVNADVKTLTQLHETEVQETEAGYNAMLILQYDKYVALKERRNSLEKEYEQKMEDVKQSTQEAISDLRTMYEAKCESIGNTLQESLEETKRQDKEHIIIREQIEDDYDNEIENLKEKFERNLKDEREMNIRLRGETGVMKKKIMTGQVETDELRLQINHYLEQHDKFKTIIQTLGRDIENLKCEIGKKDLVIQGKEKKIYELKSRDYELEKYKFVYNYKIKDLSDQIEPKEKAIKEKKEEIAKLEEDMEDLQKINSHIETELVQFHTILKEKYRDVIGYKKKEQNMNCQIKHMKDDIYRASGFSHDQRKLREAVKEIHQKHIRDDDDFITKQKEEELCTAEFQRQREYLELQVHELKKQARDQTNSKYGQGWSIMETNWGLMDEIYKTRERLKQTINSVEVMKTKLAVRLKKQMKFEDAMKLVEKAMVPLADIRTALQGETEVATRRTELLKTEVARLLKKPRACFALRPNIKQAAHYVTEQDVIYAAGATLILHNHRERRQRFIKLYEKSLQLELITISQTRRYCGIIVNGDKPQISVYDLVTLTKRRVLNTPPGSTATRFESIAFSHDDKYLMAVTGDPDSKMITYRWAKAKIEATIDANVPTSSATAIEVFCSPSDSSEVLLIGNGLFRLLRFKDTVWTQYGFSKAEQFNITTACWVGSERILLGTDEGKILLVDKAELKNVFDAATVTVISSKDRDDVESSTGYLDKPKHSEVGHRGEDRAVRSIVAFPRGFVYSCLPGCVHLFEKVSTTLYRKRNLFKINDPVFKDLMELNLNTVLHLSVNATQDKLLATTNRAQLYYVRLWGPDLTMTPEMPFKHLGERLHHGPITGLAICYWKPIFLTCGKLDRTVRVWNHETDTLEFIKQYDEVVHSVALHPTGQFAAFGFEESLQFMKMLMDDIQPEKEFKIKRCKLTVFSNHGHYLAAAHQSVVHVFSCIALQNVFNLTGHTGEVKAINWSPNDKKIVTCGTDGAVFTWDVATGQQISSVVDGRVSYSDCVCTADGRYIYVIGSGRLLQEIKDGKVLRAVDLEQSSLTHLVMSKSDLIMFVGSGNGTVLSVSMPIMEPTEYALFHYHNADILQMKLSYNDNTLVTVSATGTLIIWQLTQTEGKTSILDEDFTYSTDVLIHKPNLQQKISTINELTQKLGHFEVEHTQMMKEKEANYAGQIRQIHDKENRVIEELRHQNELLERSQIDELYNIDLDVGRLKKKQMTEKQDLVINYTRKLTVENEKFEALNKATDEMIERYEAQLVELEQRKKASVKEIEVEYGEKIKNLNETLQNSYGVHGDRLRVNETVKQQTEDDADREIVETRAKYEAMLKEERDNIVILRAEAVTMKKKYVDEQKGIEKYKQEVSQHQIEHEKYLSVITSLEKDIVDLRKEINDRTLTIQDKEKRIYDLKKKIQELEKFKLVLDYKIRELENQLNPQIKELADKGEQITDMELEFENIHKVNTSLRLQNVEVRDKIKATDLELENLIEKYKQSQKVMECMKKDLYEMWKQTGERTSLQQGIKNIYHKYNENEPSAVPDLQEQFMKQRECLENAAAALKRTLEKNKKQEDGSKLVQDNALLIDELNNLRKELDIQIKKEKALEKMLGVKPGRMLTPKEGFQKLQSRLKQQEVITEKEKTKQDTETKKIEILKKEVERLVDQIIFLEEEEEVEEEVEEATSGK